MSGQATILPRLATAISVDVKYIPYAARSILEFGVHNLLKLRRLSWALDDRRAAAIYAVHVQRQINGS